MTVSSLKKMGMFDKNVNALNCCLLCRVEKQVFFM